MSRKKPLLHSEVKGVYRDTANGVWKANIYVNGKLVHLYAGKSRKEAEAARLAVDKYLAWEAKYEPQLVLDFA